MVVVDEGRSPLMQAKARISYLEARERELIARFAYIRCVVERIRCAVLADQVVAGDPEFCRRLQCEYEALGTALDLLPEPDNEP